MAGIRKKIVWLPYDFDTACGINNEGSLVFSYNLEDIDTVDGTANGAKVFNGQDSVLWTNLRTCFYSDIKSMYQDLRSKGVLSYDKVEKMFEDHQAKWPEAIFNEDAQFKYIDPLISEGTTTYLPMAQGSKAEQRKWWLSNRFRYLDSKYNAGDALSDVIQLRGYAKADITVTPYADIYPTIKYGSYLAQTRGQRNVPTTLECKVDNVNDTEIYIYSASQLASVGDLSPLKVGLADFSKATKIQSVKLGDKDANYSNPNLRKGNTGSSALSFGNNTLLKVIDLRNCVNYDDTLVISGCTNIEEVYLDGTKATGLELPNGGVLRALHLPDTITNLTIRNQTKITDFVLSSYSNISTLWLENPAAAVPSKAILNAISDNSRVRLIDVYWECTNSAEISTLMDHMDKMRGLDENGNNMDHIQVSGVIHTNSLKGADIEAYSTRYPTITVKADHTESYLYYYNYDGSQLLYTETVLDGKDGGTYTGKPSRAATPANTFTFVGWSRNANATTADPNFAKAVVADRKVYAAYSVTGRTYTVRFYNGSTLLQTVNSVAYGANASFSGDATTLTNDKGWKFKEWSPSPNNIQGDTNCYAQFQSPVEEVEIADDWDTIISNINNGTATYKVGNYKPFTLTYNGTEYTYNAQIVGENVDEKEDGTKVRYSWLTKEATRLTKRWGDSLAIDTYKYVDVHYWGPSIYNTNSTSSAPYISPIYRRLKAGTTATVTMTFTAKQAFKIVSMASDLLLSGYGSSRGLDAKLVITVNGTEIYNKLGNEEITKAGTSVSISSGEDVALVVSFTQDSGADPLNNKFTYFSLASFKATDESGTQIAFNTCYESAPVSTRSTDQVGVEATYKDGTGSIGGYGKSTIRTYMNNDVKAMLPANIQAAIKPVVKHWGYWPTYTDGAFQKDGSSVEEVWLPSWYELSGQTYYENAVGAKYTDMFPDNNARRKKMQNATSDSYSYYWSRSAYSGGRSYAVYVRSNGNGSNNDVSYDNFLCVGFCI